MVALLGLDSMSSVGVERFKFMLKGTEICTWFANRLGNEIGRRKLD